jgi:hypothetical protein
MSAVSYIVAIFTDIHLNAFEIPKLRGYFAHRYPDEVLFHNHLPENRAAYSYPKIQYRVIHSHPALLGIGEGVDLIKDIILHDHNLEIGNRSFSVKEFQVDLFEEEFGQSSGFYDYRFASPWMALNQENYKDYVKMNSIQQKKRLKQILKGNLLTISKAFAYTIPDFDEIEVDGWFKPVSRNFHNIPMHCFTGEFTVNFKLPQHLALGKQIARGFGVVAPHKEER